MRTMLICIAVALAVGGCEKKQSTPTAHDYVVSAQSWARNVHVGDTLILPFNAWYAGEYVWKTIDETTEYQKVELQDWYPNSWVITAKRGRVVAIWYGRTR